MSVLFVLLLTGCDAVEGFLGNPQSRIVDAERALAGGDLTAAVAGYRAALAIAPNDVQATSGLAWLELMRGNATAADAMLAALPPGEHSGDVELRRALVALQAGDLDGVKAHGLASGKAAGRLFAGEVELADGNRDAARANFEVARDAPGAVGELAGQYLAVLADPDPKVVGLAETQALWALGRRATAVRSVEELVKAYADAHEDGAEQILIWAGRAAAMGEVGVADRLLDGITVPPAGQSWRVGATRAIARCAAGDVAGCQAGLQSVRTTAPPDGYADATVTAAVALSGTDAGAARALVAGIRTDAAARLLAELGDRTAALGFAVDPVLKGNL